MDVFSVFKSDEASSGGCGTFSREPDHEQACIFCRRDLVADVDACLSHLVTRRENPSVIINGCHEKA
jgi:hypothetical protein